MAANNKSTETVKVMVRTRPMNQKEFDRGKLLIHILSVHITTWFLSRLPMMILFLSFVMKIYELHLCI